MSALRDDAYTDDDGAKNGIHEADTAAEKALHLPDGESRGCGFGQARQVSEVRDGPGGNQHGEARQNCGGKLATSARGVRQVTRHVKVANRVFAAEQIHRAALHFGCDWGRHLFAGQYAVGRDSRSFGYASHHLYGVARASAATCSGPGHLSDHDKYVVGAAEQGGARLLVLRVLVRLCDFRGWDRSLLC